MKKRSYIYIIDLIIFIISLVGFYHVEQKAGLPVTFEFGSLKINEIKYPDAEIPFKLGDEILSINNIPVSTQEEIEYLLDRMEIGGIATVNVKRNSESINLEIQLVHFYGLRYLLLQFIIGCFFFFLGIFVFVRKPDDASAQVLHWAFVACAVIVLNTWGNYSIEPKGIGQLIRIIFSIAYAFTPVIFLHFTFIFPRIKISNMKKYIVPLYSVAVILSIWMGITFIQASLQVSIDKFNNFETVFDICRYFFILCVLLSVGNFIHSYITAKEEPDRRKLRWILLGFIIGPLSFIFLWVLPQTLTSKGLVEEDIILLIMMIVPITFTISITKYHILDIDLIFRRSTVYSIVLVSVLLTYSVIIGTIILIVGTLTVSTSLIISSVAAVFIALLFQPIKNRIQIFVDKKFFHVKYNYREVERRCIEEIKYCADNKQLADFIVNEIDNLIPAEKIGFFEMNEANMRLNLLSHKNFKVLEGSSVKFEIDKLQILLDKPTALQEYLEPGITFEAGDKTMFNRWGLVIVFPMLSESSKILGFFVLGPKKSGFSYSVEDVDLLNVITVQSGLAMERILLQQKLILEKAEAQRLNELNLMKSFFVSSVSHDLKTPLTSIRLFAELLQSNPNFSDEKKLEYLQIIEGESTRLSRLIDNVLDFSKIEKGIKEYRFEKINLNEIINGVIKLLNYQFQINRFNVTASLAQVDLFINADKDAIEEALINLISNSMKYSAERKEISISTYRKSDYAVIEVADKGIGISEDNLKRIFEPYLRVETSEMRNITGAGLGLTIVKHIVDSHQGKIEVESTVGKGSVFRLLFPLLK